MKYKHKFNLLGQLKQIELQTLRRLVKRRLDKRRLVKRQLVKRQLVKSIKVASIGQVVKECAILSRNKVKLSICQVIIKFGI